MSIDAVLQQNQDRLMSIPGVEGVGIGGTKESPVIIVMVRQGRTEMAGKLPREIGGYPVQVEVEGEIRAL